MFVENISIEELKHITTCVNSAFHDHFFALSMKIDSYNLKTAIQQLVTKNPISYEDYFKLAALGIIKGNKGQEEFSNKLYKDFF